MRESNPILPLSRSLLSRQCNTVVVLSNFGASGRNNGTLIKAPLEDATDKEDCEQMVPRDMPFGWFEYQSKITLEQRLAKR